MDGLADSSQGISMERNGIKSSEELRRSLRAVDRKSYPAYKSLAGGYDFGRYQLWIDHVQGDPFASPSNVHIEISQKVAGFPEDYYKAGPARRALSDFLIRQFAGQVETYNFKAKGSGKSGLFSVSKCGQQVLERTACTINPSNGDISVHFEAGFPANGRTVNARELDKMLFGLLPDCVSSSLFYKNIDQKMLESVIYLSEDQHTIRKNLSSMGLVAFIADGSVLPRKSGISQKPLRNCVKFQSPDTYRVSFDLPHHGTITGMGIPKGITLIVGGGYHGKSTLLKALELGVYDHVKGDGREFVITDPTAMKIRAEDGRSITNTDISMFINNLPNGKNTVSFDTEDASGSTSQAANVVEAMETDSSLFLIDEDTSATNFMIRDELMQRVVLRDQEPITPFIERIRELYERYGISSIIVAGSCGSYFHPADHIIQMDQYIPKDITTAAKDAAKDFPMVSLPEKKHPDPCFDRCFNAGNHLKKERKIKMKTLGKDAFSINKDTVDLRYVEQIADTEQTTALGYALLYAKLHLMDGKKDLRTVADELMQIIETKGLSTILDSKYVKSNLAMPRKQEIMAAMNRYRNL